MVTLFRTSSPRLSAEQNDLNSEQLSPAQPQPTQARYYPIRASCLCSQGAQYAATLVSALTSPCPARTSELTSMSSPQSRTPSPPMLSVHILSPSLRLPFHHILAFKQSGCVPCRCHVYSSPNTTRACSSIHCTAKRCAVISEISRSILCGRMIVGAKTTARLREVI